MSKLLSYFKTLLESFLSSKAEWIQEQSMPSEHLQNFGIPEAGQRHSYVAPANGYVVIYGDACTYLDILGYSATGNATRFTCETETATNKSGSIPIKKGSSFSIYYIGSITEFYFVQCGH